jgi:hypothetical protein
LPKVSTGLKAAAASPRNGRGGAAAGEVHDHGTYEQDNPVTRESHSHHPWKVAALGSRVIPFSNGRTYAEARAHRQRIASVEWVEVQGKGNRSRGPICEMAVGGTHSSDEVGEGMASDPAERRRTVLVRNRAREP